MTVDLEQAYRVMTLARQVDLVMWKLARSGRAHFAVPCSGQEAIGAGYGLALRAGFDFVAPHYRDLAAMLAIGMAPEEAFLSFFGKADDPNSAGRQPYAHWGSARLRVISQQGPQPNHVSHGVGVAWGSRVLGEDSITWVAFGDGGAQKGEVHEAMNFAAIHRLPVVFCIENNRYTQSVPSRLESSVPDLVLRAAGYGMPGEAVDGRNVEAVHGAAFRAIARARAGDGPSLVEAHCDRFLGNTSNDDDSRYRDPAEVVEARAQDPLAQLRARLPAARCDALDEEAMRTAAEAAQWAEAQPYGDPETIRRHTYA
ncbi:MAG TPA: thiamine pyrophosphate-dependent dehydrogenase E1 component subunit alpha [Candidatus Dormibacteraeota bacterium]|nr:thiamine pyrophosphate-dependent dehydrogenase E1 component subunit alpha [Candidatus Dormibacteraeota bacterium]